MIIIAASEQPDEADLVDALRAGCPFVMVLNHPGCFPSIGFAHDRDALDIRFLAYTL